MTRNIFIDFDGMKFDTLPSQVDFLNHYFGIQSTLSEHQGNGNNLDEIVWRHTGNRNISRDEIYRIFGEEYLSSLDWHKDVLPMQDAPEVLFLLSEKYTLYSVTARQEHGKHIIEHLLDKHAPNCISHIHCVWKKTEQGFYQKSKTDFIQSIEGLNIAFFDDSPHEIAKTKTIIPSFLFDPFDIYSHIPNGEKVSSWKEIGRRFL